MMLAAMRLAPTSLTADDVRGNFTDVTTRAWAGAAGASSRPGAVLAGGQPAVALARRDATTATHSSVFGSGLRYRRRHPTRRTVVPLQSALPRAELDIWPRGSGRVP